MLFFTILQLLLKKPVIFFSFLRSTCRNCCWSLCKDAQGSPAFLSRAPVGAHTPFHFHTDEAVSWLSATLPDSKPSVP